MLEKCTYLLPVKEWSAFAITITNEFFITSLHTIAIVITQKDVFICN